MTNQTSGGCAARHDGFHCTRNRGHAGAHIARGIDGAKLATWRADRSRRSARA